MAENNTSASLEIHFEDDISASALTAAKQLEKLRDAMTADTKAISAMQTAMKRLKAGGMESGAAYQALNGKLKEHKARLGDAQNEYLKLGGGLLSTNKPAKEFKSNLTKWKEELAKLPGPLGGVANKIGMLQKLLTAKRLVLIGTAVAILAVVYAFVKLSAAAINATIQLTKYGIAQREARRDEMLRLEALTKMRSRFTMTFGIKPGNAKEMQSAIDKVTASVPLAREQVEKYNEQLYKMGLRGAQQAAALEAVATKASALGDEAAQGTMGWAAAINMTGGSVRKLADDVKARFGGIVAKQMLSSEVQARKLEESYGYLFSGLDVEPLLKAKASVNALFSASTESGKALKSLLTSIIQPMVNAFTAAQPLIKRFFQGLILSGLEIGIVFLKIRKVFRRVFGPDTTKDIDLTETALAAGRTAVYLLIGVFMLLGSIALPILGSLAVAVWGLAAPFLLPIAAIAALTYAMAKFTEFIIDNWDTGWTILKETVLGVWDDFLNIDWAGLGTGIISGIVSGITTSASAVSDAVTNVAKDAWGSFKSVLRIQSPSKVFADLGAAIPAGVEQGIEQNAGGAESAASGMVNAPPAGGGGGGRAGGAQITIEVGGVVVTAQGGDAKAIAGSIRTELEQVFEQLALQLGAAIP